MSRWSDIAEWRGPTVNVGDGDSNPNEPADRMYEYRGVVVHIAVGYYEGTIAWQKNPDANVSSHFVVGRAGKIAQVVDTAIRAWTQSAGNGHWLSVENEGFLLGDRRNPGDWHLLSPQMVEANAQILARAHREHGVPLQLATSPLGRGLGYHSMGAENGFNWGHSACPGAAIKAQLPLVLQRAIQIVNGTSSPRGATPMFFLQIKGQQAVYVSNGVTTRNVPGGPWPWIERLVNPQGAYGVPFFGDLPDLDSLLRLGGPLEQGPAPVALTPEDRAAIVEELKVALAPAISGLASTVNAEVRDAIADLGEGGAQKVREDAP